MNAMISETKNSASELMKKATPSTFLSKRRTWLAPGRPSGCRFTLAAMAAPPVGEIGVLAVPQWAATANLRQRAAEILWRWRRGGGPLEGVAVPRVVARLRAVAQAVDDVPDEDQRAEPHQR